ILISISVFFFYIKYVTTKIYTLSLHDALPISTNNFTKEEVELLKSMFETKFGLNCTVQLLSKKGGNTPKDKYSIYVKVSSLPKLRELVLPYMHSSMMYKLGL